jgi:hypothetical protein
MPGTRGSHLLDIGSAVEEVTMQVREEFAAVERRFGTPSPDPGSGEITR